MPAIVTLQLKEIIMLSQQLLSGLNDIHIDETGNESNDVSADEDFGSVLLDLQEKRNELIRSFFETQAPKLKHEHKTLLEKLVSLDEQLTIQSKVTKTLLYKQLLALKKNKKATSAYLKY